MPRLWRPLYERAPLSRAVSCDEASRQFQALHDRATHDPVLFLLTQEAQLFREMRDPLAIARPWRTSS